MASFNKVILIGNLTAIPELKQTQSGISVCSFSLAVNRSKSKDGDQVCDFFTIQCWRQQAEFVSRYFTKGSPILVCGKLQTRSWTDNQGNKRTATEVVADEVAFVGNNDQQAQAQPTSPIDYTLAPYGSTGQNYEDIPSDESLPF